MDIKWGIDLGGTKIEGAVLALQAGQAPQVLHRLRVPTEAEGGYRHIIAQVQQLVEQLKAASGLQPNQIGVAHPGILDPMTGLMKNANTTALNGRPFDKDLAAVLGIPVRLANDANCFAMAEALLGAVPDVLPDAAVVFGVILGTGVGGGWVVHGRVLNGRMGIAGEWGHNFLEESGGPCYCGRRGCIETVLSGPSLQRYYASLTGEQRPLREIAERAQAGTDASAQQTMERMIHFFGKAMAMVINIVDPDAVVLGGGVGNIDRLYTDGVAEVSKYLFNTRLDTVFLKPKLGDSAGVFGAALL